MPLVEVTIAAGRTGDQIRAMMTAVHDAVLDTVDTKSEYVRVIVREVPRTHWATGDLTIEDLAARQATDVPAEEAL